MESLPPFEQCFLQPLKGVPRPKALDIELESLLHPIAFAMPPLSAASDTTGPCSESPDGSFTTLDEASSQAAAWWESSAPANLRTPPGHEGFDAARRGLKGVCTSAAAATAAEEEEGEEEEEEEEEECLADRLGALWLGCSPPSSPTSTVAGSSSSSSVAGCGGGGGGVGGRRTTTASAAGGSFSSPPGAHPLSPIPQRASTSQLLSPPQGGARRLTYPCPSDSPQVGGSSTASGSACAGSGCSSMLLQALPRSTPPLGAAQAPPFALLKNHIARAEFARWAAARELTPTKAVGAGLLAGQPPPPCPPAGGSPLPPRQGLAAKTLPALPVVAPPPAHSGLALSPERAYQEAYAASWLRSLL